MAIVQPRSSDDPSGETLAWNLRRNLPRRRVLTMLAATLASGAFGAAARPENAAARRKSQKRQARAKGRKSHGLASAQMLTDTDDDGRLDTIVVDTNLDGAHD